VDGGKPPSIHTSRLIDGGMSEKRLVTMRLRKGTLTAEVRPDETESVLASLARWYGKYWTAHVTDDTGQLWGWAYGCSREEARERLSLDGLVEYLGTREADATYKLVVSPPGRMQ
jgi:hypothetical protein